jgi:hypothetical protein
MAEQLHSEKKTYHVQTTTDFQALLEKKHELESKLAQERMNAKNFKEAEEKFAKEMKEISQKFENTKNANQELQREVTQLQDQLQRYLFGRSTGRYFLVGRPVFFDIISGRLILFGRSTKVEQIFLIGR